MVAKSKWIVSVDGSGTSDHALVWACQNLLREVRVLLREIGCGATWQETLRLLPHKHKKHKKTR